MKNPTKDDIKFLINVWMGEKPLEQLWDSAHSVVTDGIVGAFKNAAGKTRFSVDHKAIINRALKEARESKTYQLADRLGTLSTVWLAGLKKDLIEYAKREQEAILSQ